MIDLMGAILERGGPVLWLLVVLSLAVVATGLERFWWWSTVGSEFRLHRYRRDGGGPQLDRWRHILSEEGHAMASGRQRSPATASYFLAAAVAHATKIDTRSSSPTFGGGGCVLSE